MQVAEFETVLGECLELLIFDLDVSEVDGLDWELFG